MKKYYLITTLCLGLLTGCSETTKLVTLPLKPEAVAHQYPTAHSAITIENVKDSRQEKGVDGYVNNNPLLLTNVKQWLRDSLQNSTIGICPEKKPLKLTVDLQKLYSENIYEDCVCVVFLKISKQAEGTQKPWVRYYRGQSNNILWAGSYSSVNGCFNEALRKITDSLKKDICH